MGEVLKKGGRNVKRTRQSVERVVRSSRRLAGLEPERQDSIAESSFHDLPVKNQVACRHLLSRLLPPSPLQAPRQHRRLDQHRQPSRLNLSNTSDKTLP